jgi:histidinol-phosphate aminotransferase
MAPTFVRQAVRDMDGYTPGEQPGASDRVVKLNTNENPFPPSPKVMAAVRDVEAESLRRYPNPTGDAFRAAAAKLHGLHLNNLICGNGSDDILTIATRTFVPPGGTIAYPDPTYSLYPVLAQLQDAKAVAVPWAEGYALPIEALVATGANAIYLANPNAPTGTFVPPAKVAELASAFHGAVLVDEAYVDFADGHCLGLIAHHPNVIVSRSLSKSYALAGLRRGVAGGDRRADEGQGQLQRRRDRGPGVRPVHLGLRPRGARPGDGRAGGDGLARAAEPGQLRARHRPRRPGPRGV